MIFLVDNGDVTSFFLVGLECNVECYDEFWSDQGDIFKMVSMVSPCWRWCLYRTVECICQGIASNIQI